MKPHSPKEAAQRTLRSAEEAISNLRQAIPSVVKAARIVRARKGKIIITGVGKSAYVGMKITATLTSLGEHASFLHPVEALHGDLGMVKKEDVVIAISFSGESPEVVRVVGHLFRSLRIPIIAIGTPNSTLGRIARVVIPVVIHKEGSPLNLAPMASTTASLAVGDMLASALVDSHKFGEGQFARFHPGGSLGLRLKTVGELMEADSVPLINRSDSLSEALRIITKRGKGIVGVVSSSGTLVGIITDGDVRRFVLKNKDIASRTVAEAMTKAPKTIRPNKSLKEALEQLERHKITSLFVTDTKRRPLGIVHIHDILAGA